MTIREELEWTEHLCLSERAQFYVLPGHFSIVCRI